MRDQNDQDDLDLLRDLTPNRVLKGRFVPEARLSAAGSTSGLVAERCELGLATRPTDGDGGGVARLRLAWPLGLCRDLTPREEAVCRARYSTPAGSVGYERLVRVSDMQEGDGEEIIYVRQHDLDGKQLDGWVRVRGIKASMPSYHEVAQHLAEQGMCNADGAPVTSGTVEKVLRTASDKVGIAIKARQAMAQWEDRAPG